MIASYNEEELLLRLLLGLVFPFLLLVSLRMTRLGLAKWEKRWSGEAEKWFSDLLDRGGSLHSQNISRRIVRFLLGAERVAVFSALVLLISVAWFILFPQTRPLALDLARTVLAPILDLAGRALGRAVLVLYSIALFAVALIATRHISGRSKRKNGEGYFAQPIFAVPLKIMVWLAAFFLFLFPYPGIARIFAVGILIAAFLVAFLALRPIIEEVAIGIFLSFSLGLRKGAELGLDSRYYPILELRSTHLLILKDGEPVAYPYSLLLKSETSLRNEVEPHAE